MRDALGMSFASALNGMPVTVHMPGPPISDIALPLIQPAALLGKFDLDTMAWGFRTDSPTMVVVNRIGFTATVPDPQVVGDTMNEWALHFLSWLDVLTGQHLTPVGFRPPQQASNRTCLMEREGETLVPAPVYRPFPHTYPLAQLDATTDVLEHCCALAGENEPVPLAWTLLRDARALHRVVQTRRAVIECGSAAEMAIKALLDRRGVRIPRDKRTLGNVATLLRDSGYPLAHDFTPAFLKVRNREVHLNPGWGRVTEAESQRMLEIAVDLVEDAFPLPRGMKRPW